MDPTQLAQLQQLQQMYQGGQGGPPHIGAAGGFQPQAFQVQNRPLAPAGGGGGQAAPAQTEAAPGGGGGQQQGGGQPSWAQTLMPLMKGMQGIMGKPPGAGGVIPPVQSGIGGQMPAAPNVGPGTVQGPVPNGIVNSWPYAR
jgi:hypothetical protein